ncbi:MAG TPA: VTT domain-containing protein [Candidatus Paceibacterota bacterium]|nr:VTT domain-containing protein [Candidatus Paceibacterota bacterium]
MPLGTVAALLLQYRYIVMVPLVFFMQPAVGITGGILARLGLMDAIAVYATVSLTAVAGDAMWWWIGRRYGERFVMRFGRFFGLTDAHIRFARRIFHSHYGRILIVSKVTNGFGLAIVTLFTAGMVRIPFGRYMLFNVIGEAIWSGIIVAVGYFLGDLYLRVSDLFGRFAITVLAVVAVFLVFNLLRYVNERVDALAKENGENGESGGAAA